VVVNNEHLMQGKPRLHFDFSIELLEDTYTLVLNKTQKIEGSFVARTGMSAAQVKCHRNALSTVRGIKCESPLIGTPC
jgi:hypothetical protein